MADPSETTQVAREPGREDPEEVLGAVRSLATQLGGLQEELHALRQETRGLSVPWLLLEIFFLIAVATLAAVAGLDAPVIAGVMIVAFLLVAIAEWAAARVAARERVVLYGLSAAPPGLPDDPTWFDATALDVDLEGTSTRLPPPLAD